MNFELDVFLLYTHCLQGFVHLKLCIYTVAFDQLPNRPVLYKGIENQDECFCVLSMLTN